MPQKKTPSILYIHGFASSPSSRKAQFLREKFEELGITMRIPAMDESDFFQLTLRRQRDLIERLAAEEKPNVLIGSSMGGYLSALYASEHHLDALILLAPAVDFVARWRERLGDAQLTQWREENSMEVFHHGLKTKHPAQLQPDGGTLHRTEPGRSSRPPTLVFHGVKDDVVPQARVERWVSQNKTSRLTLLDAGHELTEVLA